MTPVELGMPTSHSPPALPVLQRRASRQVMVGDVAVGGGAPITVQSMTTPRTSDIDATVQQIASSLPPAPGDRDSAPNGTRRDSRNGHSAPNDGGRGLSGEQITTIGLRSRRTLPW